MKIGEVESYYFGCWQRTGHYLFDANMQDCERSLPADFPCDFRKLDGGFLPPIQTQGVADLVHLNEWTILTFWDRSVDSRSGSCSAFVFRGTWKFNDARALAWVRFPNVMKRFKFDIVERQTVSPSTKDTP